MRKVRVLAFAFAMAVGGVTLGQPPPPVQQGPTTQPATQPTTQPTGQGAQSVQQIATFISDDAVAVARLDLPRVNPKAVEDWLNGFIEAAEPDPQVRQLQMDKLHNQTQAVQNWTSKMRQAGVEAVYAILNRQTQPVQAGPGEPQEILAAMIVVPLKPGENPQTIQDLLLPKNQGQQGDAGQRPATAVIRDAVVLAPKNWLDRLQQPAQRDVQGVQQAMTSVEGSAIQLTFLPSAKMREVAAAMADQSGGNLPQGVTPQDLKVISQDMQWMAIGLDTPPQQALRGVVQASNPQSAQEMLATIHKLLDAAKQNKTFATRVPNPERVLKMLTPTAVGDRLTVTLDSQQMDQLFKQDIATALRNIRSEQPIRAGEMPQGQQGQQHPQEGAEPRR
ncbi:MAG: hypothetical protein ACM359_01920 [Bacillota bacterium]